jgi:predicted neuraminidase
MLKKRRITLIVLAAAIYLPCLLSGRPGWPMPEVRAALPGGGEPVFRESFISPALEGRIAHVASLAPLPGGGMAAAWYSGSREGAGDVAIYLSLMDPDTGQWGGRRKVMDRGRASRDLGRYIKKVGNAVLHTDRAGRLWMFFSSISVGGWSGSTINHSYSLDRGLTWSRAERLHLSPFLNLTNNVKNRPADLDDGTFLIPVYHEFARKLSEAVRFDPETLSYEKKRISTGGRAIQPAFVSGPGGTLTALMRNMAGGYAYKAVSGDGGSSWSPLEETRLLNPDSGLDALLLSDGRMLAAANDLENGRQRLSLLVSSDSGLTWERLRVLEEGEPGEEYSYPSMARDTDGLIHIAYTYKRKRIMHAAFNEAWFTGETPCE